MRHAPVMTARSLCCCGTASRALATHAIVSLALAALLAIDPLFNLPDGLLVLPHPLLAVRPTPAHGAATEHFTSPSHGAAAAACAYDPGGSWAIGILSGPDPGSMTKGHAPVITCSSLRAGAGNMTGSTVDIASSVAEPFLLVPPPELAGKEGACCYPPSLGT